MGASTRHGMTLGAGHAPDIERRWGYIINFQFFIK